MMFWAGANQGADRWQHKSNAKRVAAIRSLASGGPRSLSWWGCNDPSSMDARALRAKVEEEHDCHTHCQADRVKQCGMGACPPSLSIAVANAGGLGACGALLMKPDEIMAWGSAVREGRAGEFQINLWIAEAPPVRDFDLVAN
jgi:hypothetical protein